MPERNNTKPKEKSGCVRALIIFVIIPMIIITIIYSGCMMYLDEALK